MKHGSASTAGVIRPDELYSLAELRRRAGMGVWAMRKARKAGLLVRKIGNARFVLGSDFISFIESKATPEVIASTEAGQENDD